MKMLKAELAAFAIACALLGGCAGEDPAVAAKVAAELAAAQEAKAQEGAVAFDDAVKKENWSLAKAQADVLIAQYPDSAAAKRVRPEYDGIKRKLDETREAARTAALWSYGTQSVKGGLQTSSAIYAKDNVDVDGTGPTQVRLIFRDHPDWGRSSYLVLQNGDFNCYGGCRVQITLDGKPAKSLPGSRPKTDEAIAMFIEDERALWKMTESAKTLEIEFPVKGLGKRSAVFEVAGLDPARMPGW
ncbi:MAG: hypothetical protein HOP03_04515 [Lysobacter sp.]|nr:hypothetical protein [Lysobacter sp.]